MGDTIGMFVAMKKINQEERRERLTATLPECRAAAEELREIDPHLSFRDSTGDGRHWVLRYHQTVIGHFWPSTNKYLIEPSRGQPRQRARWGGLEPFILAAKRKVGVI